MAGEREQQLRAYVEYLRDMGVHDFYRRGEPMLAEVDSEPVIAAQVAVTESVAETPTIAAKPTVLVEPDSVPSRPAFLEPPIAKLVSFDDLAPLPESGWLAEHRAEALNAIQEEIGDCTRCPLAYAGRRKIVFGDGDAECAADVCGRGAGGG